MLRFDRLFSMPNIDKMKTKQDTDGLVRALSHESIEIRSQASRALGDLAVSQTIGSLIVALQDENEKVRLEIVHALGKFRDSRTIQPLIATLRDKDVAVRSAAMRS